jgi:hypothetical protein
MTQLANLLSDSGFENGGEPWGNTGTVWADEVASWLPWTGTGVETLEIRPVDESWQATRGHALYVSISEMGAGSLASQGPFAVTPGTKYVFKGRRNVELVAGVEGQAYAGFRVVFYDSLLAIISDVRIAHTLAANTVGVHYDEQIMTAPAGCTQARVQIALSGVGPGSSYASAYFDDVEFGPLVLRPPPIVERPHFDFPFRRDPETSKVVVVEQDTPEHILACENMIVRCPLGFREERPEFGWPFPTFGNAPLNVGQLESALRKFEPRSYAKGTEYADVADAAVRHIQIEAGTT